MRQACGDGHEDPGDRRLDSSVVAVLGDNAKRKGHRGRLGLRTVDDLLHPLPAPLHQDRRAHPRRGEAPRGQVLTLSGGSSVRRSRPTATGAAAARRHRVETVLEADGPAAAR